MREIELLKAIYTAKLEKGASGLEDIEKEFSLPKSEAKREIKGLARKGLVEGDVEDLALTKKGRASLRVVMIGGAFEIIHSGHIHTIREAGKLGDVLVVVVATDKTVAKNKGREPVTSEEWRVELVSSIKYVDVAILGSKGSIYDTLEKVRPDIVAVGYDQKHSEKEIENEARRRGFEVSVVRLRTPIPGIKTSKILNSFV